MQKISVEVVFSDKVSAEQIATFARIMARSGERVIGLADKVKVGASTQTVSFEGEKRKAIFSSKGLVMEWLK